MVSLGGRARCPVTLRPNYGVLSALPSGDKRPKSACTLARGRRSSRGHRNRLGTRAVAMTPGTCYPWPEGVRTHWGRSERTWHLAVQAYQSSSARSWSHGMKGRSVWRWGSRGGSRPRSVRASATRPTTISVHATASAAPGDQQRRRQRRHPTAMSQRWTKHRSTTPLPATRRPRVIRLMRMSRRQRRRCLNLMLMRILPPSSRAVPRRRRPSLNRPCGRSRRDRGRRAQAAARCAGRHRRRS